MNNFKKICSVENLIGCRRGGFQTLPYTRLGWLVLLFLLTSFIYFSPPVLAVSAEKGNFVVLGRPGEANGIKDVLMQEKIKICRRPGIEDIVPASLDSGTVVLVLEKIKIKAEIFYEVKTIGREGGMIGWVSEDYIYKIVPEPKNE